MNFTNDSMTALAVRDLTDGLRAVHVWGMLGWQDIKQRYRRSLLGPLWLTLSTAVMVVSLGLVYASIFKMPLEQYFPFLAIGLVVWTLISTSITEGCQVFISSEPVIKQIRLPFSVHACRCLWRNAIILGHNMIIIVAIVVMFQPGVSLGLLLLLIPSLVLIFLSGLWVTLLLGMICARFRDVPQVISSVLQIVFFLTPIIWHPSLLSGRQRVVYWNPLYHYVELIRMPLLGEAPSAHTWIMTVAITVLGWCFTFAFFRRFRGRIAYWV